MVHADHAPNRIDLPLCSAGSRRLEVQVRAAIRSGEINDLTLQWHAGLTTIGFEAFQSWGLTILGRRLPFDGAIWAPLTTSGVASDTRAHIRGAHLHRMQSAVMEDFDEVRQIDIAARRPVGSAMNISVLDVKWQSPKYAALIAHALRFQMMNSLSVHFAQSHSSVPQFIMLVRHREDDRFSIEEAREFCLIAPHLMQAYANRRKLFLDSPTVGSNAGPVAVALVDHDGVVHDAHARFVSMMRREWGDWSGNQLPDAMLGLNARWSGKRWTFLGTQVSAEFSPVENLYLVTVRPRHLIDVLTSREGEVAQRYASGESFRQIAESLDLAPATVRSHLRNVFGKLKIRNKTQLAATLR